LHVLRTVTKEGGSERGEAGGKRDGRNGPKTGRGWILLSVMSLHVFYDGNLFLLFSSLIYLMVFVPDFTYSCTLQFLAFCFLELFSFSPRRANRSWMDFERDWKEWPPQLRKLFITTWFLSVRSPHFALLRGAGRSILSIWISSDGGRKGKD
jgi:hypothetical protein